MSVEGGARPVGRREQTTSQIRSAAITEFSEVGPRAFSLQGVAKRAFVSIGAVYERWPNSDACIADLVTTELPPHVDDITDSWTSGQQPIVGLVQRDLTDALALDDLRFIVECVFAARDRPDLRPYVESEIRRLGDAVARRIDLDGITPTAAWWASSTWLGHALLATSGCDIPETFAPEVALLMAHISRANRPKEWTPPVFPQSDVPSPRPTPITASDKTGEALIQAAAEIVGAEGVNEADTRRIAQRAGMSTGAIYRRYAGRGDVLDDVLKAELTPERYAWVRDFAAALAQEDGIEAGARYLATLVARTWSDQRSAQLLLEITVAAHTDDKALAGVMREITKVANARTDLLSQFGEAGFIRSDLSASTLAWLLQVPPVGMRILASIGMTPTDDELTELMAVYLTFLLTDNSPSV